MEQIVVIKSSIDNGSSKQLKAVFLILYLYLDLQYSMTKFPHSYWLSGFVSGEGCFCVFISKSTTHISGKQVKLYFTIG